MVHTWQSQTLQLIGKTSLFFARFWFFVPVFISIDQNQERVWKKVTFLFGLQ
jgi:hypothetical protein